MSPGLPISRRAFLRAGVAGVASLALSRLTVLASPAAARPASPSPEVYGDWRDIYRGRWSWDRVANGTHSNANCVSACAWKLYVRDGIVWREEQAGSYDEGQADCPDFNPRGCQKGACASDLFVGSTRLSYPLVRVGERGEGRWKRVAWDEALDRVAEALVESVRSQGGHGLIAELGPEMDYGPHTGAAMRFFKMLGAPITDSMAMIGDVAFGGTMTLGTAHTDGSSDDWFRSDYLVQWAFNPVMTRIPDAHFLTELRYRGGRVINIAPDYSPSTIHTDLWLNPKPGTDAALALAAVQVILEENRHDSAYLREQTDLPLLVRSDNGRFLRESDLRQGGARDVFYVWDEATERVAPAPGSKGSGSDSLALGDLRPALEGSWMVALADGEAIAVEPVFARLKATLDRDCRPESAERITGVRAANIRRFAREFASAERALILSQYGSCKFYHSDLLQRSQILLASVTGNIGKAGAGWRSGAFIMMEGMAVLAMQRDLGLVDLLLLATRSYFKDPEENLADFSQYFVPAGLWHYIHAGLEERGGRKEYGDPKLPRPVSDYVDEALDGGWFPIARGEPPKFLFSIFGNVLRHSRSADLIKKSLWPKLEAAVTVDFRMSETALASDVVLPAASWYEKIGFKYIPGMIPYVTLSENAVEPYAESRPEWWIFHRLAERVTTKAREKGVDGYDDYLGKRRRLAELAASFSDDGRFGADDEEKVAEFILSVSTASKGLDLAELRDLGHRRIAGMGQQGGTTGVYSDYSSSEPMVPMRWFVEDKRPYPTLTGRQQFYVDHRWFLELGEELPCFKPPPSAGGDYPLTLSGGHARWSIHAIWRDHRWMLRLQRGEPVALVGAADARARGIRDHDRVRVYNDVASALLRAKVVANMPQGFISVYHAWEPFQFDGGTSHQHLAPAPLKVTQLAGDYGHLGWSYGHYEPGQVDRDTKVEIERMA